MDCRSGQRIAQSITDACNQRAFSSKLIIVVRHDDASKFSLNLFQVRDYLGQSLHAKWMSLAMRHALSRKVGPRQTVDSHEPTSRP